MPNDEPHEEPAAALLERWRSGDQVAAGEIHRRYAQRLCGLAQGQLSEGLSRRLDADDIVQSVFRTFFRRARGGEFTLDHSGSLWSLLVRITLNKVRKEAERHRAAKRDLRLEQPAVEDGLEPEAVAHDPTPDEAAALADALETVVRGLDAREAEVFRLRLQGRSASEIGEQVGCTRWTVRRVLDRVGERLKKELLCER
ncbi:MAG: sigma-70 family RNA polymerase sigma factor [Planctomycetes bacterium]|nr:sigma-70 family RNA polymerase sigma factor [Planctomycetota bacterium]